MGKVLGILAAIWVLVWVTMAVVNATSTGLNDDGYVTSTAWTPTPVAVYHELDKGIRVRCADGWASPSIGEQGACSSHGGVATFYQVRLDPESGFSNLPPRGSPDLDTNEWFPYGVQLQGGRWVIHGCIHISDLYRESDMLVTDWTTQSQWPCPTG